MKKEENDETQRENEEVKEDEEASANVELEQNEENEENMQEDSKIDDTEETEHAEQNESRGTQEEQEMEEGHRTSTPILIQNRDMVVPETDYCRTSIEMSNFRATAYLRLRLCRTSFSRVGKVWLQAATVFSPCLLFERRILFFILFYYNFFQKNSESRCTSTSSSASSPSFGVVSFGQALRSAYNECQTTQADEEFTEATSSESEHANEEKAGEKREVRQLYFFI